MNRRDRKYLIIEGVVVLFGVLIALVVDHARQQWLEDQEAQVALSRVYLELNHNLSQLKDLQTVGSDRLARLRALRSMQVEGQSLADLLSHFSGYRTPDLNEAAWNRLVQSRLADSLDPHLLEQAFQIYEANQLFDGLDWEINRLVYSELFHSADKRAVAIAISERIMAQQLTWVAEQIPRYAEFLCTAPDDVLTDRPSTC